MGLDGRWELVGVEVSSGGWRDGRWKLELLVRGA